MKKWIYSLAATLFLLSGGLVHGIMTDRWHSDPGIASAVEKLSAIPMQIGEWEGQDLEVKKSQIGAGVAGCLQRTYFNRRLGATVTMAIVNGRPGPIAIHTPEACYGAAGYKVDRRSPFSLEGTEGTNQFWTAEATRARVAEETRLRLFWAWNGGDGWKASADPRSDFPRYRSPILHKLYVIRDVSDKSRQSAHDRDEVCSSFLDVFIPVLEESLFSKGG